MHRFVSKPLRLSELPGLVAGAIREAALEAENVRLVAELSVKNDGVVNSSFGGPGRREATEVSGTCDVMGISVAGHIVVV